MASLKQATHTDPDAVGFFSRWIFSVFAPEPLRSGMSNSGRAPSQGRMDATISS